MFVVRETGRIATKLVLCVCLALITILVMLSVVGKGHQNEPVFLVERQQLGVDEMLRVIRSEESADRVIASYQLQEIMNMDDWGELWQAQNTKEENEPAIEAYTNWIEKTHEILDDDPISQKLWQKLFPEEQIPMDMLSKNLFLVLLICILMLSLCFFGICLFFPRRIRKFEPYFPCVLLGGRRGLPRFSRKKTWREKNLGNLIDFPLS
jgi:hypothetical protein